MEDTSTVQDFLLQTSPLKPMGNGITRLELQGIMNKVMLYHQIKLSRWEKVKFPENFLVRDIRKYDVS